MVDRIAPSKRKFMMKRIFTDTSPEYVAKRLQLFRKSLGMRQVDLARELSWSQQKWGQWENARRTPNIPDMIEIADRYGVTLDYIYRGDMSRLPEWMAKKIRELVASDPIVDPAPGSSRPKAAATIAATRKK